MIFREAQITDIEQMHAVRNMVKENVLSDPKLVTNADYKDFITKRGKGWVCIIADNIVGFSIADLHDQNIWALFVNPGYEGKGIGRRLHNIMLDWYFSQSQQKVWLGTSPNTRAEAFYRIAGWKEVGKHGKAEIKFEMTCNDWKRKF